MDTNLSFICTHSIGETHLSLNLGYTADASKNASMFLYTVSLLWMNGFKSDYKP